MCKKLLNDVVIIRPLAIFLLVVWHSFIIYTGGWKQPENFKPIETYWWIAKGSYACMLELFVFISGYVFALGLEKKNPTLKNVLVGKFKRLIIPGIIFSLVYYVMFYDIHNFSISSFAIKILSGCGHMWFLPMLFWTTIFVYLIDKISIPEYLKLIGCFALPVLSFLPIPLGLSTAFYYMPFFYLGVCVYRKRESILNKTSKSLIIKLLIGGGITFWIGSLAIRDVLSQYLETSSIIVKYCSLIVGKYIQIIYALLGIAFIYMFVNYFTHIKECRISKWIIELNATCFGIYLFQQFILQILYYKTSLPTIVGPYWLPWVGLFITLVTSYILTKLSLKTNIGRQLM